MFTPKVLLSLFCIVSAGAAFAQSDKQARTAAQITEDVEGTGERAPAPPPRSSAEDAASVDLEANEYGVGTPATEEEIAKVDIDVMPDGGGLPKGRGTFAEGEAVYAEKCLACHGENLEGVADLGAPRLVGGRDTLASDQPVKTVESYWPYASTLFDYVHRAMPMDAPGSLSPDEVYAVSAYILGRAGIAPTDAEATLDAESFARISMPNADGFVEDPRTEGQY